MHKLKSKNKNNKMIIDHDDDNNSRFLNNNPSFSSSLLDQIYRSIDQGDTRSPEMRFYREKTTSTKKKQINKEKTETSALDKNNRVCEKYYVVSAGTEKSIRRKRSSDEHVDQDSMFFNSFSSVSFSSDSCSSSCGFSSSDTESLYGTRSSSSCFAPLRPKPVRTSMSFRYEEQGDHKFHSFHHDLGAESGVLAGDYDKSGLIKSKSRALKIYNNLKKVKQPISPGGKITSFLNSIFAHSKKTRSTNEDRITTTTKSYPTRRSRVFEGEEGTIVSNKLPQASTNYCSSASSFSRSCLSKTNSSEREKLYNGMKRSVRFYHPVSEVVSEDRRPYDHKKVCDKKSSMKNTNLEKSRVVDEVAREFLDEYNKKNKNNHLRLKDLNFHMNNIEDEDDDDDVASCASSDLFELDHLAVFGSAKYSEELPVYETTHVSTNRAISNGFIS